MAFDLKNAKFVEAEEPAQPSQTVPPKQEISAARSFGMGGVQGGSAGTFDEAVGFWKTGGQWIRDKVGLDKKYKDTYAENRDDARKQFADAEAANPTAYMAGDVAGSLALAAVPIPGAQANAGRGAYQVGKFLTKQAGIGGVQGAGRSDADTVGGVVKDAAKEAALSAGTAGFLKGTAVTADSLKNAFQYTTKHGGPVSAIIHKLGLEGDTKLVAELTAAWASGGWTLLAPIVSKLANSNTGQKVVDATATAVKKTAATGQNLVGKVTPALTDEQQTQPKDQQPVVETPKFDLKNAKFVEDVAPSEKPTMSAPKASNPTSSISEHPAVQSNPLLPTFFAGLAQLETAGGKKTIKGSDGQDTNNLFNIKDFSRNGTGIRARDKAEGSNDRYRTYASHDESTADLIRLLQRKYPKALSARTPEEFAYALKEGGYATDPKYVSKLVGTINSRVA